jgi:hypothetical protein
MNMLDTVFVYTWQNVIYNLGHVPRFANVFAFDISNQHPGMQRVMGHSSGGYIKYQCATFEFLVGPHNQSLALLCLKN